MRTFTFRWFKNIELQVGGAISQGGQKSSLVPKEGPSNLGLTVSCRNPASLPCSPLQLEPDGLLVWILAGTLGLSLVCSLVLVPLQCFQLSRVYGCCLLLLYLTFLVVALLTEFGVIHLKTV